MKIGYGYRRDPDELKEAGAERVYVDRDGRRAERADMLRTGLRSGDVLLLFFLRDLGGSPVADRVWQGRVEALGVSVEIIPRDTKPKRMGAPRKFKPTLEQHTLIRAVWLDGADTERVRLDKASAIYGGVLTRDMLHRRYGNPTNPKPDDDMEPK